MSEKRLGLLALSIFFLFTCILFAPVFFGKVNLNGNLLVSFFAVYGENLPFKDTGWDQLRIYYPFYKFTIDSLRHFAIPFWNPYAFSGHPHFADLQSAALYPMNIFGLFTTQILFWHILRLTPSIIAAFFTFQYLRNLKIAPIASTFGALIFGFSPYLIVWGEEVVMTPHSIIYMPLALLAVDKLRNKFDRFYFSALAASITLSILAGYIQTSLYFFVFLFFYLLFRTISVESKFRFIMITVVGIFLGLVISAVQLVPSIELFVNSQRLGVDFSSIAKSWLLPPSALITYLIPDFFGHPATYNHFLAGNALYYEGILFIGIPTLIFAFYALIVRKGQLAIFLALSIVISLATVMDSWLSRVFVSLPIPLVSTAIPHRILFIPAFSLAILGSMGLNDWIKDNKSRMYKILFLFAVLYIAIFVSVLVRADYFVSKTLTAENIISLRNTAIPIIVFITTAFSILIVKDRRYAAIIVILISASNIYYFSNKYLSFTERKYVFPKTEALDYIADNQGYSRTLFVGDRKFSNNFATQYSIFNPEGYDSLNNKAYSNFVFKSQGASSDFIALRRSDAELGLKDNLNDAFRDNRKLDLINLLGVKYLVAHGQDREILAGHKYFEKVYGEGAVDIFENKYVLDRAFISSNVENINDDTIDKFSKVEILEYGPQKVKVAVDVKAKGYLVLTDNYYPGWNVKVDGQRKEILKANTTFKAVEVDPGRHIIEFNYSSSTFVVSALLSIIGILLLGYSTFSKIFIYNSQVVKHQTEHGKN